MRALTAPTALGAAVLVASLLTGCPPSRHSPGTPAQGDLTAEPTPTATTTTTSAAPAPETAPASGPTSIVDRLLPTAEVPGLRAGWHWQDGDTGEPTTDPFGLCAKVDLASIG